MNPLILIRMRLTMHCSARAAAGTRKRKEDEAEGI